MLLIGNIEAADILWQELQFHGSRFIELSLYILEQHSLILQLLPSHLPGLTIALLLRPLLEPLQHVLSLLLLPLEPLNPLIQDRNFIGRVHILEEPGLGGGLGLERSLGAIDMVQEVAVVLGHVRHQALRGNWGAHQLPDLWVTGEFVQRIQNYRVADVRLQLYYRHQVAHSAQGQGPQRQVGFRAEQPHRFDAAKVRCHNYKFINNKCLPGQISSFQQTISSSISEDCGDHTLLLLDQQAAIEALLIGSEKIYIPCHVYRSWLVVSLSLGDIPRGFNLQRQIHIFLALPRLNCTILQFPLKLLILPSQTGALLMQLLNE